MSARCFNSNQSPAARPRRRPPHRPRPGGYRGHVGPRRTTWGSCKSKTVALIASTTRSRKTSHYSRLHLSARLQLHARYAEDGVAAGRRDWPRLPPVGGSPAAGRAVGVEGHGPARDAPRPGVRGAVGGRRATRVVEPIRTGGRGLRASCRPGGRQPGEATRWPASVVPDTSRARVTTHGRRAWGRSMPTAAGLVPPASLYADMSRWLPSTGAISTTCRPMRCQPAAGRRPPLCAIQQRSGGARPSSDGARSSRQRARRNRRGLRFCRVGRCCAARRGRPSPGAGPDVEW